MVTGVGETQMALCVHNGFCSRSKEGKEGGKISFSYSVPSPFSAQPCSLSSIHHQIINDQTTPSLCSHGLLHQLRQMNIKTVFPLNPKDKGSKHEDVEHCDFDCRRARWFIPMNIEHYSRHPCACMVWHGHVVSSVAAVSVQDWGQPGSDRRPRAWLWVEDIVT